MKYTIKRREHPAQATYSPNESGEDQINLIWSTGYKGLRSDFDGSFYEELEMTSEACDLSRLNSGAPFLNQHTQNTTDTLGVVTEARIENGIGTATIRLSKRPELQGIIEDIKAGILRNISVGYKVLQYTDISSRGDSVRTYKATNWQPLEISLVAVGFDPFAQVLRSDSETNEVEIIEQQKIRTSPMTLEELQAKLDAGESLTPEEQTQYDKLIAEKVAAEEQAKAASEAHRKEAEETLKRQAVEEFKERSNSILTATKAAGFDEAFATELIARNISVQDATIEIFKKLETKNNKSNEQVKEQRQMSKNQQLEQALLNRINARKFECDSNNPFKGATLMNIAENVVERRAGETDMKFAERAVASADLANLLSNVSNKALAEDPSVQYSYSKLAEEIQLRDFKATPIVRMSASGLTAKSSETGEYTDTSLVDSGETITLQDLGAIFKISFKALMNDDLGVLTKLPQKADQMGGRSIETQLYAVLNTNGNMADGKALFHVDHANIITGGTAPSVAALDSAQQKMSAFTDGSGNPLDLTIKYIVVPPSQALAAQKVAAEITAGTSADVNPFGGKVEVIVSSRISQVGGKDAWFVMADPAEYAALVYGVMQGQGDKPEVAVEEDFNSKNMKVRITQPSAAAAASYKGIVRIVLA